MGFRLTSTADNTLRRKSTVSAGDSNGSDAFDPATEWDGYATDTFDGLGTHASVCSVDMPPAVSSVSPADGATDVVITANIVVEFSEAVDVSDGWYTLDCTNSGAHTTAVTGGPDSFILNPDANFTFGESCTVVLYADQVIDQNGTPDAMASNYQWSFTVSSGGTCNTAATFIHAIQGDGDSSPLAGTSGVVIEGIVVGDFQNTTTELSSFFMQEEAADMDVDINTSEGIFIYDNGFGVDVMWMLSASLDG